MEEAHDRRLFELLVNNKQLDFGVTEVDIANAEPRVEFEDDPEVATEDADNTVVGEDQNDIIIMDQATGDTY